jgi:hypothetical protein
MGNEQSKTLDERFEALHNDHEMSDKEWCEQYVVLAEEDAEVRQVLEAEAGEDDSERGEDCEISRVMTNGTVVNSEADKKASVGDKVKRWIQTNPAEVRLWFSNHPHKRIAQILKPLVKAKRLRDQVLACRTHLHTAAEALQQWFEELPVKLFEWFKRSPWLAGFLGINVVLMITAPFIMGPLLGLFGFSAAGPVAGIHISSSLLGQLLMIEVGTVASSWMAAYGGSVPAAGLYAVLQSAAMGGFGAPIVTGVIQFGAAASSTIAAWFGRS